MSFALKVCDLFAFKDIRFAISGFLIGLIILLSGSFGLNASLKAKTDHQGFEKVLFGSEIALGSVMIIFVVGCQFVKN